MPMLSRRSFVHLASASAVAAYLPAFACAADPHILVPASVCGRWGFLNERFEFEIKAQYEAVFGFASDLAAVQLNGKWGYIDRKGKIILAPQYDEARNFHYGSSPVRIGKLWGFVKPNGQFAIPLRFELARSLQDSRSRVMLNGSGVLSIPREKW